MPPDMARRRPSSGADAHTAADHGTSFVASAATVGGPTFWYGEAETHLRIAARKLEVLGLVDQEAARLALVVYRLASRVRTDRLAAAA